MSLKLKDRFRRLEKHWSSLLPPNKEASVEEIAMEMAVTLRQMDTSLLTVQLAIAR